MARARKIERFLSQPFHVAEVFTGSPGKLVSLADTIKGFKGLVDGKYDHLPEAGLLHGRHRSTRRSRRRRSSRPKRPDDSIYPIDGVANSAAQGSSGGVTDRISAKNFGDAPWRTFISNSCRLKGSFSPARCESVVVPGTEGQFTVLKDHAPLMSTLKPGVIDIVEIGIEVMRFFVRGGFADVAPAGLTILADHAVPLEEVDAAKIAADIKDAEDEVAAATTDEGRRVAVEKRDQLIEVKGALKI